MFKRPPDRIIRKDYLARWHIIPRNRWFNIYLHRFTASDDDRALHDHPWWSVSFKLKGELVEILEAPADNLYGAQEGEEVVTPILGIWPVLRSPQHLHRLVLITPVAWTLFITGPRVRTWGFKASDGSWVPYYEFGDYINDRGSKNEDIL